MSLMALQRAPASSSPVLSATNLCVTYTGERGRTHALDGVDLAIREGEFVSLLGPSGCGKSTLLRVACGLLPPTSGAMELRGQKISGPTSNIGIVFQQPTLLPWKSVVENVLVPCDILGHPRGRTKPRALELLQLMGLASFTDHYPGELSGGMQQRVGLARSLVHDPDLLLMDEPFAALDALTREQIALELQALWLRQTKSVMFITHSIPEAVFLSDRIVVLSRRPGRVIRELNIDLPRPRSLDTMRTAQFGNTCHELRELFAVSGTID
jgi:NitT/TauT family transport system ATP-binding protein